MTGAGIGGAAIASKVTNNASVATGIGLGFVAAAKAGVQYSERVVHRNTQDSIAKEAGPLDVGGVAPWSITHTELWIINDGPFRRELEKAAAATGVSARVKFLGTLPKYSDVLEKLGQSHV